MSRSPLAAAETNIRVRTLESEHKSRLSALLVIPAKASRRELSTTWTRRENHRYHHGRRRGQLPAPRPLVQASLPGARPRPPRKLLRTGRIRLNVKVTRRTGKSTGIQRYC